jgi:hypothetical protein
MSVIAFVASSYRFFRVQGLLYVGAAVQGFNPRCLQLYHSKAFCR